MGTIENPNKDVEMVCEFLATIARLSESLYQTRQTKRGRAPTSLAMSCLQDRKPSISVDDYVRDMYHSAEGKVSSSSFVIAMLYLDRINERHSAFLLTERTVHR